jgi:hypothetical protein
MKRYLVPAAIVAVLAIALIATPILANNAKTNSGCCADQVGVQSTAPVCTTACPAVAGFQITCADPGSAIAACDPNVPCAMPGCPAGAASIGAAAVASGTPVCPMADCPMAGGASSIDQASQSAPTATVSVCPVMTSAPSGAMACPAMPAGGCGMMK